MKWLFRSPTYDEVVRLLAAWRIWLLGALVGGIAACLFYFIVPPPYRAQATILIDHNSEQVIPKEWSDRRRFYYLAEENDKLIQVAWSDEVLERVSDQADVPVDELREEFLHLSQPGDGGWHLMAESPDPDQTRELASLWAQAFYTALAQGGTGINPIMDFALLQEEYIQPERSVAWSVYLLFGTFAGWAVMAFLILFFHRKDN